MTLVFQLTYKGEKGKALLFAQEVEASGIAATIRNREGNLRYEYFVSQSDPETVLLVDEWANQEALDRHHASPQMGEIMALREKYDLRMTARRLLSDDDQFSEQDRHFIRE